MDGTIKYLKAAELKSLFSAIRKDCSRHRSRNLALFSVAEYCALRVSEVSLLREDDYCRETHEIYCHRLKGSRNNMLRIIDPDIYSALDDYLTIKKKLYPQSPYMFVSQLGSPISRQSLDILMRSYCAETDITPDKHHFHVLKHTRAVELAEYGVDIKDVQFWLGHMNVQNTLVYMQFTTKQQELLYWKLKKQITGRSGGSI